MQEPASLDVHQRLALRAVDGDVGAIDEARAGRCDERDHGRDLVGLADAAERDARDGELVGAVLVAFVASPRASFINGAHIPVDGAQRKALMDV